MDFETCIQSHPAVLMEGALGERLKREYGLHLDEHVALARLIYTKAGADALAVLWRQYRAIAQRHALPFLATTPTRRANRERVNQPDAPSTLLADNVAFLRRIQQESDAPMFVGGLMGCKGDAYTGAGALDAEDARAFHSWQPNQLAQARVDFLYAAIMPTLPEALGIAQAMADTGLPYLISFTLQADGRLVGGDTLCDAITAIDAAVSRSPTCYMTNCVHPRIVHQALSQPFNQSALVRRRFLGIQANTSPLSYAELDGAADLHCADPEPFAEEMLALRGICDLKIFGGCCGTDDRHMEAIARRL